uniref:Uncharacterized protein n=1 Tax=Arundo donax TaxID=35708 RepID=A0A0A8ZPR9_ARUDO
MNLVLLLRLAWW